MTNEIVDPIELYGTLNPVSPERQDALADAPERETTLARITARREPPSLGSRRLPKRRLLIAVVVAVALAVPALAFSGALGSLFAFSNQGTPVTQDDQGVVNEVRMVTGETPSKVVQLASRNGWTFYAARTTSDVCYFDKPAAQSESGTPDADSNGIGGGSCKNAAGESNFPSPPRPIFNMSHYFGTPNGGESIGILAGVAADGVAAVQVLALGDCHVVATAPVIDNVYIADNLPMIPEAQIVARDTNGNAVWHQAVGAAIQPAPPSSSCGLG